MDFLIRNTGFDYFSLFLALSLLVLFAGFIISARSKSKIPFYKLTGVFATGVVFMLAGAKLLTIEPEQWKHFLLTGQFPECTRITILGALLFGPLGILIGKKIYKINTPVLDFMAIPALLAMSVQRLGCLFAGCCHGLPNSFGFGVQYEAYSIAHINSFECGRINDISQLTPGLHPVPLYLMAVCIISALILYKIKNLFKVQGNYFIAAITLFIIGRFVTEFFRDPMTNGIFGQTTLGLKYLQWIFLFVITSLIAFIIFRERKATHNTIVYNDFCFPNAFFVLLNLTFIFLLWRTSLFNETEKRIVLVFLYVHVFTVVLFLLHWLFKPKAVHSYVFFSALICIIAPVTAQIAFNNEKENTGQTYVYQEFSVGFSHLNFSHYHEHAKAEYIPPSCGSDGFYKYQYPQTYSHNINLFGATFSRYHNYGKYERFFYRAMVSAGTDKDTDPEHTDNNNHSEFNTFDCLTSVGGDSKILGGEFQLHFGTFRDADGSTGERLNSLSGGQKYFKLIPSARVRIGFAKYLYCDARAGTMTMGINSSKYPFSVAMATGYGADNGRYLRFGLGMTGKNLTYEAGIKIIFLKNFGAEFNGSFGDETNISGSLSYFLPSKN